MDERDEPLPEEPDEPEEEPAPAMELVDEVRSPDCIPEDWRLLRHSSKSESKDFCRSSL